MCNAVTHFSNPSVLQQVLDRLSIQELREVKSVCKQWHKVANEVFWKAQCQLNWKANQPCNDSWKARFRAYRNWEKGVCFIETYPNFLPPPVGQSSWDYSAKLFPDHLTQIFYDEKYKVSPRIIYLNNWPEQKIVEIKRKGTICKWALNVNLLAILNNSKNIEIYDKRTGDKKRLIKADELGLTKQASRFQIAFQDDWLFIWNSRAKTEGELGMKVWLSSKNRIVPLTTINGRPIDKKAKFNGDKLKINETFPRGFGVCLIRTIGDDNENEGSATDVMLGI